MAVSDRRRGLLDAAKTICPWCRDSDNWSDARHINTKLEAEGLTSKLSIIGHLTTKRLGLASGGIELCHASAIIRKVLE